MDVVRVSDEAPPDRLSGRSRVGSVRTEIRRHPYGGKLQRMTGVSLRRDTVESTE